MTSEFSSRQSFLGEDSDTSIQSCRVGIVGLGGGGSHIAQQLAHVGFRDYVLYDPDTIEESNRNRLIGSKVADPVLKRKKVDIATDLILGIQPEATITKKFCEWQVEPDDLKLCDIIMGCIDGYMNRRDLERLCRRFLIPYIDIGLDVIHLPNRTPRMNGQVILSLPEGPCMHCMGFLTEENIKKEAEKYGDAGINPQVVWANGMLASAAVGLAVDLVTSWTGIERTYEYLVYDGNTNTLGVPMHHKHMDFTKHDSKCPHFNIEETGAPRFLAI